MQYIDPPETIRLDSHVPAEEIDERRKEMRGELYRQTLLAGDFALIPGELPPLPNGNRRFIITAKDPADALTHWHSRIKPKIDRSTVFSVSAARIAESDFYFVRLGIR